MFFLPNAVAVERGKEAAALSPVLVGQGSTVARLHRRALRRPDRWLPGLWIGHGVDRSGVRFGVDAFQPLDGDTRGQGHEELRIGIGVAAEDLARLPTGCALVCCPNPEDGEVGGLAPLMAI